MKALPLGVALLVVIGGGTAYLLATKTTTAVEPQTVERTEPDNSPPPANMRVVDGAKLFADPDKTPANQRIELPDGKWAPVLNGAVGAPLLNWPKDRVYAPLIGKEIGAAGEEWYVHADGSKWTTSNYWRKDLGRMDALTRLFVPATLAPPLEETGDGKR